MASVIFWQKSIPLHSLESANTKTEKKKAALAMQTPHYHIITIFKINLKIKNNKNDEKLF
ncbi:MAG: hypothetical protein PUG15_00950 [Bacteroidales bacterium]|nr:hypothetical protein [Bacteroidales bacterium]